MAIRKTGQLQLAQALGGAGSAKKQRFDLETLKSASEVINERLKGSQKKYSDKKKKRGLRGTLGSMAGTALAVGAGLATGGASTALLMAYGAGGSLIGGELGRSGGMGFKTGDVEITDDYLTLLKNEDPDLAKRVEHMALQGSLKEQKAQYEAEQLRTKEAEESLATSITSKDEGSYASSLFKKRSGDPRYEVWGDIASGAAAGASAGISAGGAGEIAKKQASGVLASGGKSGLSDTFKNIGWMYGSSPSKAVDESTGNLSAEVFRSGNQVQTNLADAGQKTLGSYIQSGYTKYKPVANRLMTDVYIRNYFNQMGAEDFYSPNYSGGVQGDFS